MGVVERGGVVLKAESQKLVAAQKTDSDTLPSVVPKASGLLGAGQWGLFEVEFFQVCFLGFHGLTAIGLDL